MPEAPKAADPEPAVAAPADPPSVAPVPQQKPVIQYVEKEPSMTSLRIKAEKEKELAEAENYWRKRFAKQEREVKYFHWKSLNFIEEIWKLTSYSIHHWLI